jgi:hypothetical protein
LEHINFCVRCGSSLQQRRCPSCDYPVDPSWGRCPRCQREINAAGAVGGGAIEGSGTMAGGQKASTVVMDGALPPGFPPVGTAATVEPTRRAGEPVKSPTVMIKPPAGGEKKKTVIMGASGDASSAPKPKLIGWLVTFSRDAAGRDYRLREGRSAIGSNFDNEVVITDDLKVSGHHATLLWQAGKLYLRDEMSTNGTFVNGAAISDQRKEIASGDKIQVGETELIVKII